MGGSFTSEQVKQFNYETKTKFDNEYYEKEGDYYIICFRSNIKYEVIVDEEFFLFLQLHNRKLQLDSRGYAYITRQDNHSQLFIHNLILYGFDYYDKNIGRFVDHINSKNIRDDRKSNLRPANDFENNCNRKLNNNSTTGIKGITINRPKDQIRPIIKVRIGKDYKRTTKAFHFDLEGLHSAILWNLKTRKEIHKEFTNYGFDIEGKDINIVIEEQCNIFINNLSGNDKCVFNRTKVIHN